MNKQTPVSADVEWADDICSLSLARRMAALLDRDPFAIQVGDPLPRGWHVMLFNPPTRQSQLRGDGAASLGFKMPDMGLPRLMMGGRRIAFLGDIPVGAPVRRRSTLGPISMKNGSVGDFALVEVEHRLSLDGADDPVVIETSSYVMLPASNAAATEAASGEKAGWSTPDFPEDAVKRVIHPDETMLFRYSAITDNPHRIHYDQPYATATEGYPSLVVNGSLPQMAMLELFREHTGRQPNRYAGRNRAPIFCGHPLTLVLRLTGEDYSLDAYTDDGILAIEATVS